MKELSMEEKAKRYDEALAKARNIVNSINVGLIGKDSFEAVFPELKESEDKNIKKLLKLAVEQTAWLKSDKDKCYKWLEKQGEHANFRNKIQVGDKVTRNKDGVLVNLSQLKRVAKPAEEYNITGIGSKHATGKLAKKIKELKPLNEILDKQGEQKDILEDAILDSNEDGLIAETLGVKQGEKTADMVEPKFKVGDWVVYTGYLLKDSGKESCVMQVASIEDGRYNFTDTSTLCFDSEKDMRLWTIKDAKNGDVLVLNNEVFIYAHRKQMYSIAVAQCYVDSAGGFYFDGEFGYTEKGNSICPATKEQRDLLFTKMKEAGYEWNAEKKELKKIEQKPAFEMKTPEESLGVDSDTYNKIVDGCIYGEQNPAWSEEDEAGLGDAIWAIEQARTIAKDENDMGNLWYAENWLKSLKDRVQPQTKQEWSERDYKLLNDAISLADECDDIELRYWLKSLLNNC
jgi:hypothetical protein